MSSLKPLVKQALSQMGASAGASLGARLGSRQKGLTMGKTIGEKISKIVGSGDYEVSDRPVVNSLFPGAGGGGNGYAQFSNPAQATRIQHREYLQDVLTSGTAGLFSITPYQINPGLAFTFPYLANIAMNFEEYKVKGMVFEFISTASPYAANSAMGSVIMAMEYNAAAPAFTNKPQMENSDFAISARFDKNMVYGVECSTNSQNTYYVRSSGSPLPLTTTDLGTMYVATQPSASYNAAAAVNIGELWVSYDIEFLRPRISPARFGYAHFTGTTVGAGRATMNLIPKTVYGTLTGATLTQVAAALSFTFPNADLGDTYQVLLNAGTTGVNTFSGPIGIGAHAGFTDVTVLGGLSVPSYPSWSINAAQVASSGDIVLVSAPSPIFTATLPNSLGGGHDIDIIFYDIGNGFTSATL